MTTLRTLLSRSLDALLRRRRDRDFDDEVQAHLDLLTDEYVARGVPPDEARFAARRDFGGVDQVKSLYRDQRGLPWLDALMQDVRFASRVLVRDRGFTLTALLVLAVGIGISHMFFTIVYAYTMRGLPIERPDRVLHISYFDDRVPDMPVSWRDFEALRSAQRSFQGLEAFVNAAVTVGDEGRAPDRFDGAFVTSGVFDVVGTRPHLGRLMTTTEEGPGAEPVVLLGATAWRARYESDPHILGRSVLINGSRATVVGVVPDGSGVPSTAAVWIPIGQMPDLAGEGRDARTLRVLGRLTEGVTERDARAEIDAIVTHIAAAQPDTHGNLRTRVVPINERVTARFEGAWFAFATAGLIIVLVSCTNVANLMLARAMHRAPELAVRASLGASRARLVRQLLVESTLLAILGGAAGLAVSAAGVRVFFGVIPEGITPYWVDYSLDLRAFAALVTASFGAALLFGLLPAIHASKTDVTRVLKSGDRTGTGARGHRRLATAFLAVQLALAVTLLAQVGLASLGTTADVPTDRAIETSEVLTATLMLPADRYATPDLRAAFVRRAEERLGAHPSLEAHTFASSLPVSGASASGLHIAGRPRSESDDAPTVWGVAIGPRYFETLRLRLVRGREFSTADGRPGQTHALVNERLAELFFAGDDPLGQRIALIPPDAATTAAEWLTIVGVVPTVRQRPTPTPDPVVYLPIHAAPPAAIMLMARGQEATGLASLLRTEMQALDDGVPLFRMRTLSQAVLDAQWNGRVSARLAETVSLLAILLATIGLYAVTAHGVGLRRREIGLRMALGARQWQVVQVVLRVVRVPLVLGFSLALIGSMLWDRAFSVGVADARAADPRLLLVVTAAVATITVVACFVPARRAARLDPARALRHD